MEWVETTGKSVEEAKELALDQLGVDEADAEFEMIEEPKSGLFGRTRGVARVRARVSPKAPPAKAERRRRAPKRSGAPETGTGAASGSSVETAPTPKGRQGRAAEGNGEDVSRGTPSKRDGKAPSPKSERENGRSVVREQMDMDEQIQVLEKFATELASAMGLDATASAHVEDNQLTVNLSGSGLGLLVGPRLATLDAVQEIARNTLQRQAAGREYAKVVIDVENIRQQRQASLDEFVRAAADQVRSEGIEVVFDVMSSPDRKRVHDLVTDLDGVESASEGEDPRRRVVLRPQG